MNVLDAAIHRIEYIFENFEHVCVSVSGGKDSGVLVQLVNKVAAKKKCKFDIMILDIEANYTTTVQFQERCEELENINQVYHFCLPFYEDNNSSIFEPQWIMWNPEDENRWIHPLPKNAITLSNLPQSLKKYFLKANGNPDNFLRLFNQWYYEIHNEEAVAVGVGIRTQESLNRYRAIHRYKKNKFRGKIWINHYMHEIYNFYPLFDWKCEDIWKATAELDLDYNTIYDKMFKMGVAIKEMRICQPFGLVQRKGLNQFAILEPELWEKLVNRVSGANFGCLYAKTSLLGYVKSNKPKHMSWQKYTLFLLETYGIYSEQLRDHYYRKIKILMSYYEKNFNMKVEDMVDEATRKEWLKDERLWNNWKGIARALEKNDFAFSSREYSLTRKDEQELYQLFDTYHGVLGLENLNGKIYEQIIEDILIKKEKKV
ncbi:DUF3440 domain-containing protein [Enterococcus raffinosus]|uniref:DUF3440 domain-containing protein n=1 Tax=Enterococcus raffinosus TaxID=71452 RepID=UPI003ACFFEB9